MYTDLSITFTVILQPSQIKNSFPLDKTCQKYSCEMQLDKYIGYDTING